MTDEVPLVMHVVPPDAHRLSRRAHIEDSLAPAEHLSLVSIESYLRQAGLEVVTPGGLLNRARLYVEYALATPGTELDDALFRLARADAEQVLALPYDMLGPRHPHRLNAQALIDHEPGFRLRAGREPTSSEARTALRETIAQRLSDYMGDEAELPPDRHGYVSEYVAIYGLLLGDHFPYIGTDREERNIITADNHDVYTLHPCSGNRVKKAPVSVKYINTYENGVPVPDNPLVVTLKVGRIAREVVSAIPEYQRKMPPMPNKPGQFAFSLRLVADIMVCHGLGESIDETERLVMQAMADRFQAAVEGFARTAEPVDYAANARLLRRQLEAMRQRGVRNRSS